MHADGVNTLLAFFQVSLQLNYRVQCIFMDVELEEISLINKKPNIDLRIQHFDLEKTFHTSQNLTFCFKAWSSHLLRFTLG
jgi:hypothetical protein